MDEIALIYQCVFCGSYSLWTVGVLDPYDIQLRVKFSKLKKQQHDAEADAMLECSRAKWQQRLAHLPCSTCLEYHSGKSFNAASAEEWVSSTAFTAAIGLSPQVPVRFSESSSDENTTDLADDDLPPIYRCVSGKWFVAQGVGPRCLEVPSNSSETLGRIPAQQFKVLLKGKIYPLLATTLGDAAPVGSSAKSTGKAKAKAAPVQPTKQGGGSGSSEGKCSPEAVQRFLSFLWGEVDNYEALLRSLLIEEKACAVEVSHFVQRPLFCLGDEELLSFENELQVQC